MTNSQRTERNTYAEVFTNLRQAFADLGVHPHALTFDSEARDENAEPVMMLGWLTSRQAETLIESVRKLQKEADR